MSTYELRPVESHELGAYASCQAAAFGTRLSAQQLEYLETELAPERSVAVFDGAEVVGSASSHDLAMTMPGLCRGRVAAVTDVSVAPTHRRRGLLTAMMRRQLDDLYEKGEQVAALYASEGGIYGRFGYGVATYGAHYVVDKRRARFTADLLDPPGQVRLVEREQGLEAFPAVYEAYLPTRAGEIDRLRGVWRELLPEPGDPLSDERERFYVCYEHRGRIDGYAVYRVASFDPADRHRRAVYLEDLCSLSPEAYGALWRYLIGVDLTEELRTRGRPVDEPLRYLLDDPRQLRVTGAGDRTWLRLVDVAGALAGRRYGDDGAVVLRVTDAFCPWNEDRYRLSADGAGTPQVEQLPAEGPADLSLDVATLGSVYLGGVPFAGLAVAGRVHEHTTGAVRRADRLFLGEALPFCTTNF